VYDKYYLEQERPNHKQLVQIFQIFPKRHHSPPIHVTTEVMETSRDHPVSARILSRLSAQHKRLFLAHPQHWPVVPNVLRRAQYLLAYPGGCELHDTTQPALAGSHQQAGQCALKQAGGLDGAQGLDGPDEGENLPVDAVEESESSTDSREWYTQTALFLQGLFQKQDWYDRSLLRRTSRTETLNYMCHLQDPSNSRCCHRS